MYQTNLNVKAARKEKARRSETPMQKRKRMEADVRIKWHAYKYLTMLSSKADRSEASRQEETPEQRLARLNDKVSIISILYNLMQFNNTFFPFRLIVPF